MPPITALFIQNIRNMGIIEIKSVETIACAIWGNGFIKESKNSIKRWAFDILIKFSTISLWNYGEKKSSEQHKPWCLWSNLKFSKLSDSEWFYLFSEDCFGGFGYCFGTYLLFTFGWECLWSWWWWLWSWWWPSWAFTNWIEKECYASIIARMTIFLTIFL